VAAAVGSVIVGVAACRLVTVATAAAAPIRPAIFLSMISPVEYSPSRLAYNSFCGGMVPNVGGGFRSVGFAMAGTAGVQSSKMLHAALLLLMLEAVHADLVEPSA